MNTPRTKKPKRWEHTFPKDAVSGSYSMGLHDNKYTQALGSIISTWPHIEEMMMHVFAELLGVLPSDGIATRQLYRSIINAKTRIDIMRNLLERGHSNKFRGEEYDEIIDEFKTLNSMRNDYAHGMWSTHESGSVFLAVSSMDEFWLLKENRKVEVEELNRAIKRMYDFQKRAREIIGRDLTKRMTDRAAQSSPQKPLLPHDENSQ